MSSTPPPLPLPGNVSEASLPPLAAAAPVLPYASPLGYAGGPQVWREGGTLIAHKHAAFPDRCIKCGSADGVTPLRRTLYWHNPALYVLILFPGLLVYAIVALIVRQTAKLEIGLCPVHRKRRRTHVLIAWLWVAAAVLMFFAAAAVNDRDWPVFLVLFGILGIFVGLVWGLVGARVITPKRMDRDWVWIQGAGVEFLQAVPDVRSA